MPTMPSIWDNSLTLYEFEARVQAARLGKPMPRRSPAPLRQVVRPPARTPTPAARAYAAGAQSARADALAVIAVCNEFGRGDLLHQVVGLTPAAARQYVIDQMWSDAFDQARATPSWMPR